MRLLILTLLFASSAQADFAVYPYAAIGVGYKIQEPSYVMRDDDRISVSFGGTDTALFEAGFETDYNITFGIKHDSQYSTGWPFNSDPEYYKTEVFIRYKIGGRK